MLRSTRGSSPMKFSGSGSKVYAYFAPVLLYLMRKSSGRRALGGFLKIGLIYSGLHYVYDRFFKDKQKHSKDFKAKDIVEEASEESFPASDPPSWTALQ